MREREREKKKINESTVIRIWTKLDILLFFFNLTVGMLDEQCLFYYNGILWNTNLVLNVFRSADRQNVNYTFIEIIIWLKILLNYTRCFQLQFNIKKRLSLTCILRVNCVFKSDANCFFPSKLLCILCIELRGCVPGLFEERHNSQGIIKY